MILHSTRYQTKYLLAKRFPNKQQPTAWKLILSLQQFQNSTFRTTFLLSSTQKKVL